MDRRDFIKKLGVLGAARWTRTQAALQAATASLKQLAQEKGLLFGSCLALKYCAQSAAYQQLFLAQCDIATPELHMKWNSLSSQPGVYDFSDADKFVAFCSSSAHQSTGAHAGLARRFAGLGDPTAYSGNWASDDDWPYPHGSWALRG